MTPAISYWTYAQRFDASANAVGRAIQRTGRCTEYVTQIDEYGYRLGTERVGLTNAGKMTLLWSKDGSKGADVYAQRFGSNNYKNGSRLTVANTDTNNISGQFEASFNTNGDYVVAGPYYPNTSDPANYGSGIYGQSVTADGQLNGAAFIVAQPTSTHDDVNDLYNVNTLSVAYGDSGNALILWTQRHRVRDSANNVLSDTEELVGRLYSAQ
jgi:hypothetical protein